MALPMLLRPAVAVLLLFGGGSALRVVNLALCSAILMATATVFGVLHVRLEHAWDEREHRRLLRYNLVRAVA